jgi:hypothetical protein
VTTKITVDTHAGWPVNVTTMHTKDGEVFETGETIQVAPLTVQDFFVWDGKGLLITEVQKTKT